MRGERGLGGAAGAAAPTRATRPPAEPRPRAVSPLFRARPPARAQDAADGKAAAKLGLKGEKAEKAEGGGKKGAAAAAAAKKKKAAAASAAAEAAASMRAELRPKYMTPAEVLEVIKRLWRNEWGLLQHVYACEGGPGGGGDDSRAFRSARDEGYQMFFLRRIAVAPNKFRPPSVLGEEMFEHVQNTVLAKVLGAALDLSGAGQAAAPAAPGGGPPTPGGFLDASGGLDLARYMNTWLGMQDAVRFLCGCCSQPAGGGEEGGGAVARALLPPAAPSRRRRLSARPALNPPLSHP